MSLWLAGSAGQVSLARTGDANADGDADGLRAAVDQHAAEIRDALGGRLTVGSLMGYARGFTEAAVARGWWPPQQRTPLDWESLRLAAICRLFLEANGLMP
jgi:hypothetical protein